MGDCGYHGFNHVTCFGCTDWQRCFFNRWNGDTDADGINVFISFVALMIIHQDKTARIHQSLRFDMTHGIDTGRFTFTPAECAGSVVEPRDLRLQLQR